jgi:hypothetical protein
MDGRAFVGTHSSVASRVLWLSAGGRRLLAELDFPKP